MRAGFTPRAAASGRNARTPSQRGRRPTKPKYHGPLADTLTASDERAAAAAAAAAAKARARDAAATRVAATAALPLDAILQLAADAARARALAGGDEVGDDNGSSSSRRSTRGRGAKKTAERSVLAAHVAALAAGLDAETAAEREVAEARLRKWPRDRLVGAGVALFGLRASRAGALLGDALVKLEPDGDLPDHTFGPGDTVLLSPGEAAALDGAGIEGVLMDYTPRWLRVALLPASARALASSPPATRWRVDLHANTAPAERCAAALAAFATPPPATGDEAAGGVLRRALVGAGRADAVAEAAAATPLWAAANKPGVAAAAALVAGLNPAQAAAARAALGRVVTLWRGPPGTGKTRTLAALVSAFAASPLRASAGQILVTAPSNVAVDNIVVALLAAGVRVARVGVPAKVAPAARAACVAALAAATPAGRSAAAARAAAAASPPGAAGRADRERADALDAAATAAALDSVAVVAATCVGAGDDALTGRRFALVALDEATQATEPASLIPLLANTGAALLVGDPAQLPPTVVTPAGAAAGLATSLFERLANAGVPTQLLDTQYRMHPALAAFPSARFYARALKNGVSASDRPPPSGLAWPHPSIPIAFAQCDGPERAAGLSAIASDGRTTLANHAEADAIVSAVASLLAAADVPPSEIGVITPYAGQARLLRDRLAQRLGAAAAASIEVKTVDGFQGREKDVILLSPVRANPAARVGFLADARRLNVAITRARRGLVVVGDRGTLAGDGTWGAWLGAAARAGCAVGGVDALVGEWH